jgi:hypothetical protein
MASLPNDDYRVKVALWHGLALETQKYYVTTIEFFQIWCIFNNQTSWSVTLQNLEKWAVNRMYGSTLNKQGKIKIAIIQSYLSGIRSYHIDHLYDLDVFDHPRLQKILRGGKRMFSTIKANRLPITKNILQLITQYPIFIIDDVNFDTTFKIAWAGFLRLDEITYTTSDLKKKAAFIAIKTTRSDISFAENDQYAILRLKRSKTDVNHSGVQIMLAAINEATCPVRALRRLFCMNPQPINALLFRLVDGSGSFSRIAAIKVLKIRLAEKRINAKSYSRHSFRKGAAQHAFDNDMLDENIQRLRRWTSNAFQLYFKTSMESRFHLNLNFQQGRPLAIPRVVHSNLTQSIGYSDTLPPLGTPSLGD